MKNRVFSLLSCVVLASTMPMCAMIPEQTQDTDNKILILVSRDAKRITDGPDTDFLIRDLWRAMKLDVPIIAREQLIKEALMLQQRSAGDLGNVQAAMEAFDGAVEQLRQAEQEVRRAKEAEERAAQEAAMAGAALAQHQATAYDPISYTEAQEYLREQLELARNLSATETALCETQHATNQAEMVLISAKIVIWDKKTSLDAAKEAANAAAYDIDCSAQRLLCHESSAWCIVWPKEKPLELDVETSTITELQTDDTPSLLTTLQRRNRRATYRGSTQALPELLALISHSAAENRAWHIALNGHGTETSAKHTQHARAAAHAGPDARMAEMDMHDLRDFLAALYHKELAASVTIKTCFGGGRHARETAAHMTEIEGTGSGRSFPIVIMATSDNVTYDSGIETPYYLRCTASDYLIQPEQLAYRFDYACALAAGRDPRILYTQRFNLGSIPQVRLPNQQSFTAHKRLATTISERDAHRDVTVEKGRVLYLDSSHRIDGTITLCGPSDYELPAIASGISRSVAHHLNTLQISCTQSTGDIETLEWLSRAINTVFGTVTTPYNKLFFIRKLILASEEDDKRETFYNIYIRTYQECCHPELIAVFRHNGHFYKLTPPVSDGQGIKELTVEQYARESAKLMRRIGE